MKVILLQDSRLGKKGSIVNVSDGYATNYLIPRGLAVVSTEGSRKTLAKHNAEEEARQKALKAEAEKVKERLEHINVEFTAKAGDKGQMFGTISPKQIEEGLKEQWGIEIDKRKFIDKYPANAFGYTRLRIELYKGSEGTVIGTVNVHISEEK
jgi:large subunit ribosomal protein L9